MPHEDGAAVRQWQLHRRLSVRYIHRHPIHRRAFRDGVQCVIAKDCRRGEDFTRRNQIKKRRRDNRVESDLLRLELFDQLYASDSDHRADDFVTGIADGHSHAAF